MDLFIVAIVSLLLNYDNIPLGVLKVTPIFLFVAVIIRGGGASKKYADPMIFKRVYWVFILFIMLVWGVVSSQLNTLTLLYKINKILTLFVVIVAYIFEINKYIRRGKDLITIFVHLVYKPLIIYISLNIILFLLGLQDTKVDEDTRRALLFSLLGMSMDRVRFFLASGINAYGAFLGVVLVIGLTGTFLMKKHKRIFLIGIIVSGLSLLFTDSRFPILGSFLIFFLIKFIFSKQEKPRFISIVPLLGIVGPFIISYTLLFLSTTSYGVLFSRGSEDLTTANGRLYIWLPSFSEFLSFKSQHVFGYGLFGHYTSGRSLDWSFVFSDSSAAEIIHPHNTYLSILFDYGYLGMLIYMIIQYMIIAVIREKWQTDKEITYILLANLLYLNMVGVVETLFGFYYQNMIYLFFMVNIFSFVLSANSRKETKNLQSDNL